MFVSVVDASASSSATPVWVLTEAASPVHPRAAEMRDDGAMTMIWFIVWLICNVIGDHEPLLFDPVNWWTGTLLAAIALDLGRQHKDLAAQ